MLTSTAALPTSGYQNGQRTSADATEIDIEFKNSHVAMAHCCLQRYVYQLPPHHIKTRSEEQATSNKLENRNTKRPSSSLAMTRGIGSHTRHCTGTRGTKSNVVITKTPEHLKTERENRKGSAKAAQRHAARLHETKTQHKPQTMPLYYTQTSHQNGVESVCR